MMAAAAFPIPAAAQSAPSTRQPASHTQGRESMSTITTKDGVEIFYKDWGQGQPIVFSHGWPLSSDAWDAQMLFFVQGGFRVIAHDRRGHGRSTQVSSGHDMDHYAADLAALTEHLDLRNAVHVGHSTGGGEVARYVARHGQGRVAKAALVSAVTPLIVKTAGNPGGLPKEGSTACRRRSRRTASSSSTTFRPGRSTATTGRAPSRRKASSGTGGARG
jgi:non-heme chloroperoxidase